LNKQQQQSVTQQSGQLRAHHLVTADTVIKFAVVTPEKQSSELA